MFAYLADMTHAAVWDPSILSVVRLDQGDVTVGSSFQVTLGFLGRGLVLTYRVMALEPTKRVVLRAETGLLVSEDTITVSPLEGRTTRVDEARLTGKGAAVLLDPLFKLSINHFGRQAGEKLRSADQPCPLAGSLAVARVAEEGTAADGRAKHPAPSLTCVPP